MTHVSILNCLLHSAVLGYIHCSLSQGSNYLAAVLSVDAPSHNFFKDDAPWCFNFVFDSHPRGVVGPLIRRPPAFSPLAANRLLRFFPPFPTSLSVMAF